jgi:hypothetical protein
MDRRGERARPMELMISAQVVPGLGRIRVAFGSRARKMKAWDARTVRRGMHLRRVPANDAQAS